jgi:hypothetical protein
MTWDMMIDLFDSVFVKILASLAAGLLVLIVYHAFDIYLALTRQDFTNIQIMLMYFTRNDYGRDPTKGKDACQSRLFGPVTSIRETYKNRFLFWLLVFKSLRTKTDDPILSFGKDAEMFLKPIRGRIVSPSGRDEAKRAEGWKFTEGKYYFCIIRDLSDDQRRKILKVIVIRDVDLKESEKYLANPPEVGNIVLFKRIVAAYNTERKQRFLDVKITLT